jgi:hypothetical protein
MNRAKTVSKLPTSPLKGLIISEPWISLILKGEKTWEMRPRLTTHRGPIALVRKNSGVIVGIADLVDCIPRQGEAEYRTSEALHCIPRAQHKDCATRWPVAWVFTNARSLAAPVRYRHKNGAQSQVILSDKESIAVRTQHPAAFDKASATRSASPISASVTS